ncbi:MAG: SMP-30/gluconolactonase/LRE family protein [Eubacterium sp.]|nr:SMP-30/gluconolactonase/LRE family protein [Eubacterium sp.]
MSRSVIREKVSDPNAIYFTMPPQTDGLVDVSEELQNAIDQVVNTYGFGVLFIPEGTYMLSRTIYIPKAVRLIGYGENRPKFVLADNTEAFKTKKKIPYKPLLWFVNGYEDDDHVADANPGTFYSGLINIDLSLGEGNGNAVAIRCHYAQNSTIKHCELDVNSGAAGLWDVGNEIQDIDFIGGEYGIVSCKCSPGWPFVMSDCRFSGQTKACIRSHEVGFNITHTYADNAPKFLDVDEGYFEKVFMEDCIFENMNCLIDMALENNSLTQVNLLNIYAKSVETIAQYKDTNKFIPNEDNQILIKKYTHGIVATDKYPDKKMHDHIYRIPMDIDWDVVKSDFRQLPDSATWVNAKDIGLKGDGKTDDTKALQEAIEQYETIYFPQGDYIVTDTIKMKDNTSFIGLHPGSTRIILAEQTERFQGFGDAIPVIESGRSGNIIHSMAIDAGGTNPRACALKWICEDGLVDDLKIWGGHGDLEKGTGNFVNPYGPARLTDKDPHKKWDKQYPSIIVCDGGGGVLKNIWSASPYASAGIEIRDTDTPMKLYCISIEHHARCELRIRNASNIKFYGLQFEEEMGESEYSVAIEVVDSKNIAFGTVYCFSTIFVNTVHPYCAKVYHSKNIRFYNVHNFTQTKYETENFLIDMSTGVEVRPWQAAMLEVTGEGELEDREVVEKVATGFRFADGAQCDGKGNFYFLDNLDKRIYRINAQTLKLELFFESPYKINSIAFDTDDNILVIGEYTEMINPGIVPRHMEPKHLPPDAYGTSYSFWYDPTQKLVAFTIEENHIKPLEEIAVGKIKPTRVFVPGNRFRDGSDFMDVSQYKPEKAYIAPDGETIIPQYYDLMRATSLAKGKPGKRVYTVDEMYKRAVSFEVNRKGLLKKPKVEANDGDYCAVRHNDYLYVGGDDIGVYQNGKLVDLIHTPERPTSIRFGGKNKNTMFVTSRHSVFVLNGD